MRASSRSQHSVKYLVGRYNLPRYIWHCSWSTASSTLEVVPASMYCAITSYIRRRSTHLSSVVSSRLHNRIDGRLQIPPRLVCCSTIPVTPDWTVRVPTRNNSSNPVVSRFAGINHLHPPPPTCLGLTDSPTGTRWSTTLTTHRHHRRFPETTKSCFPAFHQPPRPRPPQRTQSRGGILTCCIGSTGDLDGAPCPEADDITLKHRDCLDLS